MKGAAVEKTRLPYPDVDLVRTGAMLKDRIQSADCLECIWKSSSWQKHYLPQRRSFSHVKNGCWHIGKCLAVLYKLWTICPMTDA